MLVPIHACVYRRSFLLENNITFCSILKNKEDWDFLIKVAMATDKFRYIDQHLCTYRVVMQSRSTNVGTMIVGADELFHKHMNSKSMYSIAFNLRYRIVLNRLYTLVGKTQDKNCLSMYSIAKQPEFRRAYYLNTPLAIFEIIKMTVYKIYRIWQ